MDYEKSSSNYLELNRTWHIEDSPWKATQILKMLEKHKLSPKSVAEIGCGAGEILNQLHERLEDKDIQLKGYDISPDAYEFAKERSKDRLQFFNEDLLQTNHKFDILLMIDVFEHVEDSYRFVRNSSRLAEYKIFHIPLDICALACYTNQLTGLHKSVGHIHFYNKETALIFLKDCGLEVADCFYTLSALELNKGKYNFKGNLINTVRSIFHKISPEWTVRTFGGFSLLVLAK